MQTIKYMCIVDSGYCCCLSCILYLVFVIVPLSSVIELFPTLYVK